MQQDNKELRERAAYHQPNEKELPRTFPSPFLIFPPHRPTHFMQVKTQSSQLDALEQDNKELRERAAYHQQQNKEQAAQHEAEVRLMGERHDRQLQEEAAQHLRQQEEATRQLARAVGQAHEATLQAEAAVQSRCVQTYRPRGGGGGSVRSL